MKLVVLAVVALSVSACVEYQIIGAGPDGGLISKAGRDPLMSQNTDRIMVVGLAEQVCGKYRKRAVVEEDISSQLVGFKCVDLDP